MDALPRTVEYADFGSDLYDSRFRQLVEAFLRFGPDCGECGSPTIEGYVCSFCGHDTSEDE